MLCCGGSCGLTLLPEAQLDRDWWLIVVALGIGLAAAEGIIRSITGLIVTALSATTISAEIEAETYGLLRLTSIPPHEIVLAKFSATLRQVRAPLLVLIGLRIAIIGLGGLILVALVAAGAVFASSAAASLPLVAARPAPAAALSLSLLYAMAIASALAAIVLWLAYYAVRPVLEALVFAALGTFASSLARTRSGGLLTAGALRIALGMVSYIAGQVVSSFVSLAALPLAALPALPLWFQHMISEPALVILALGLIGLLVLIVVLVIQIGLILLLLKSTIAQASRLPFRE